MVQPKAAPAPAASASASASAGTPGGGASKAEAKPKGGLFGDDAEEDLFSSKAKVGRGEGRRREGSEGEFCDCGGEALSCAALAD